MVLCQVTEIVMMYLFTSRKSEALLCEEYADTDAYSRWVPRCE